MASTSASSGTAANNAVMSGSISSTMLPGSFTIGSCVMVEKMYRCGMKDSDGGIALVRALDPEGGCVTVKYYLGGTEKGVVLARLNHHVLSAPPRAQKVAQKITCGTASAPRRPSASSCRRH